MQKVSSEETHGEDGQNLFSFEEKSGRVEEGVSENIWTARFDNPQVRQVIEVIVAQRNGDLLIFNRTFSSQCFINQILRWPFHKSQPFQIKEKTFVC